VDAKSEADQRISIHKYVHACMHTHTLQLLLLFAENPHYRV